MKSRSPLPTLHTPTFLPLPLTTIKPRGWLRDQLRIQADGLSGHLDDFWPDIKDSRWFGGNTEGWERAPHWHGKKRLDLPPSEANHQLATFPC